jgi:iron complex outermembrane recepter protein
MYTSPLVIASILLALTPAPLLYAADPAAPASTQQTGTISGRVVNAGTSQYLEGAHVVLQPTGRTVLTGRDGRFVLPQVRPGSYKLTITYAGLDSQTIDVGIAPGETFSREIELSYAIYQLGEFVVAGEREGSALAIQQQRNAPNIKNVMSADAFGNVADENIGNFLVRLPGIGTEISEGDIVYVQIRGVSSDLNAVTIDGTRAASGATHAGADRRVAIDKIPADFIETIEVTKAPTPDMDGDSIGGAVNLKTKSAFDRRGRTITYRAGAAYNIDRKSYRPAASFLYSDLLGRDERLGLMFTSSFNRTHKPRDVANLDWERTTDTDRPAYFWQTAIGEDQLKHARAGAGLRLDYKLSDNASVYINSMYSYYQDGLNRRRPSFTGITHGRVVDGFNASGVPVDDRNRTAQILPGWTESATETINHVFRYNMNLRDRRVRGWNLQTGGENRFARSLLDYNVNYSPSRGTEKRTIPQVDVPGVGFRFDRNVDHRWALTTVEQISGPDVRDPANMLFNQLNFQDDVKEERIWGAQVNYRMDFDLGKRTYFKTGFRTRSQKQEHERNRTYYRYVGPDGVMGRNPATGANDDNLARFIDQGYDYRPMNGVHENYPFFSIPTILSEFRSSPQLFTEDPVRTLRESLEQGITASEDVHAAYVMGDTQLGRLGITGGVRLEETRMTGSGTIREITPEERARQLAWPQGVPLTLEEQLRRVEAEYGNFRTNTGKYRNYFPSVHLRYEPFRGMLARASWSTGIGRPNFTTIVPQDSVSHENMLVTSNNPNLRPQESDNFDVSLEYYFEPASMVSVGLFAKELTGFIFTAEAGVIPDGPDNGFNGSYAGYTLRTQQNGGSARIRGAEFSYTQQFSRLPGFWRGFAFYANYTYLKTEGDYGTPGTTQTASELPNFIPHSGNVGLSYRDRGWTVRVQMNYTGTHLSGYNADPSRRTFNNSRKPVDLNVAYEFSPRFTLFADVINVFNDPTQNTFRYIGSRVQRSNMYTPVVKFGVSGRF